MLCPKFVHNFKGFEKDETYQEVANIIVKLAAQLKLEVDVAHAEECFESHGAELSNEDLMELDVAKVAEQTEGEPVDEPQLLATTEMATAFREIASAMVRFEKMDSNSPRFLKVNRGIDDTMACYREIYEEKKKATVQSSLDKSVREADRSAPSTSPQPSTSYASSVPLLADDKTVDVMPLSSSPSSTN
jgi:hypothetical protein